MLSPDERLRNLAKTLHDIISDDKPELYIGQLMSVSNEILAEANDRAEALRKANEQIERIELEMVERGKRTGLIHDAYEARNEELHKANEALAEARERIIKAIKTWPSANLRPLSEWVMDNPAPTADLGKANAEHPQRSK